MIQLCLEDSVLLNVSGESTTKELWEKLGNLYQSKSLVNKLFLRKKLDHLRMEDGYFVIEHLNANQQRKKMNHKKNNLILQY
jgi:hypothetical protein